MKDSLFSRVQIQFVCDAHAVNEHPQVTITPLRAWTPEDPGYSPPPRRLPSFTQVVSDWSRELSEAIPSGRSPPSSRSLSRCDSGVSEGPGGARPLRWLLDVVKNGVDDGVTGRASSVSSVSGERKQGRVQTSGGSGTQPRRRGSVVDDCDAWLHETLDKMHTNGA